MTNVLLTDLCAHLSRCRAASTTQKVLAVTSAAQDTLVTQAEGGLTTANPAPAPTMRPREGEGVTDHTQPHPDFYTTKCEKTHSPTKEEEEEQRVLQFLSDFLFLCFL